MMHLQRNRARIEIGGIVLLVLLGLSVWAFGVTTRPGVAHAAGANPQPAHPASGRMDIFIQFDGIPGECTERDHQGWCNAFSFSQDQTASTTVSSGGAGGRAILKDVVVTKPFDKASPRLAQAVRQGTHLRMVRIDVVKPISGPKPYLTYELGDVIVTGCRVTGPEGGQARPLEQISLSFREIKTTYTEYDSRGTPKPPVTSSFNVATNKAG